MPQRITPADEYARKLGLLLGNDFEDEVVITLQQTDPAFQRVPRKPNGDGGLDGFSHGRTVVYCCYGLEMIHEPGISAAEKRKRLVKKIVAKFKSDLMRLLELEHQKRKLVLKANDVLAGVYGNPPGAQITVIKCVVNWFEDNRIIGDLQAALQELVSHSNCRFVAKNCDVVVWGPKDLANNVKITQITLARVEQPSLLAAIKEAATAATQHEPADDKDFFKSKFDDLEKRHPTKHDLVENLRAAFKRSWSTSILLGERLAQDLPEVHRSFEAARPQAATEAQLASLQPGADPISVIERVRERLRVQMGEVVPGLPEQQKGELAQAEVGRLIGECPLDWRDS